MKMNRFLRKIRRSGTSLSISIPPEILEILDLKEGEIIEVEIKKVKK